jgi:hypothetical protein
MKKLLIVLTFLLQLLPAAAFAVGEIFKIETTGTEYCGDLDVSRFNARNNIDLWVEVVSDTELTVSLTSTFEEGSTFPMFGRTYQTGNSTAQFIAGVLFIDDSFATIEGEARLDRRGEIASISGIFIQDSVFELGCFSSGNFRSQRIAGIVS